MRNHRLPGKDVKASGSMPHPQPSPNDNGVFLELRRLSRFLPSCGAAHVRHAETFALRIHAAYEFVDDLGHVARCLDASGAFNMSRQFILLLTELAAIV